MKEPTGPDQPGLSQLTKDFRPLAGLMIVFTMSLLAGLAGITMAYSVKSQTVILALGAAFIAGGFLLRFVEKGPLLLLLPVFAAWMIVCGAFGGPALAAFKDILGWSTVSAAVLGTFGVMLFYGSLSFSGRLSVSRLNGPLMLMLLTLILIGALSLFIDLGKIGLVLYSLFGMSVFGLLFAVTFEDISPFNEQGGAEASCEREEADDGGPEESLSSTSSRWRDSFGHSEDLFLSFVNFFFYLLQIMAIFSAFTTLDVFRLTWVDESRALVLFRTMQIDELVVMLACLPLMSCWRRARKKKKDRQ